MFIAYEPSGTGHLRLAMWECFGIHDSNALNQRTPLSWISSEDLRRKVRIIKSNAESFIIGKRGSDPVHDHGTFTRVTIFGQRVILTIKHTV